MVAWREIEMKTVTSVSRREIGAKRADKQAISTRTRRMARFDYNELVFCSFCFNRSSIAFSCSNTASALWVWLNVDSDYDFYEFTLHPPVGQSRCVHVTTQVSYPIFSSSFRTSPRLFDSFPFYLTFCVGR